MEAYCAVFKLEQGFLLNNGAQAFSGDGFGSQAWVGLQSDPYGNLTFGRQFDVMYDLVGPLTAGSNTWGGNMAAHPFENDNLAADSVVVNNTVKYAGARLPRRDVRNDVLVQQQGRRLRK